MKIYDVPSIINNILKRETDDSIYYRIIFSNKSYAGFKVNKSSGILKVFGYFVDGVRQTVKDENAKQ